MEADVNRRALVTGASGFVGVNLMHDLLRAGWDVKGLDIRLSRDPKLASRIERCDILHPTDLRDTVQKFAPDVIFHLAARTDLNGSSVLDYPANTTGVQRVVDAMSSSPDALLISASSRLVFEIGHVPRNNYDYLPTTAYGESKAIGESLVRDSGLRWLIARPTSLWGPWFDVPYRNFFEAVRRGLYFHPRERVVHKSFGYVGNATHELIKLAGARDADLRQPYWVSDYEPYDLAEWADEIRQQLAAPRIRAVPEKVLRVLARTGDVLAGCGAPAPLTSFRLRNLITDMVYDTSETQRIVGPLPFNRKTGVGLTARWLGSDRRNTRNDSTGPRWDAPAGRQHRSWN